MTIKNEISKSKKRKTDDDIDNSANSISPPAKVLRKLKRKIKTVSENGESSVQSSKKLKSKTKTVSENKESSITPPRKLKIKTKTPSEIKETSITPPRKLKVKTKIYSENGESSITPPRKLKVKTKTDSEIKKTSVAETSITPIKKVKKSSKSSKTKKHQPKHLIALKPYNKKIEDISEKYNIPIDLVESNVSNIVKLVEENPKLKNSLFVERFPIFLQLCAWKIPIAKPKLLRIDLEHSILDTDDDVCLIVPDVKGIKHKLYEQHHDHYEEILKEKEVTGIKKIMTLHELKSEYDSFELKRGLVELYDMFLVDGRISGVVVHKLGKIFYKKRKVPTPIKMNLKLKQQVEKAFKKSSFQVHGKSDCFTVQIGHNKMSERELVENVFTAVDSLNNTFPGGMNNMRTMNIYSQRGGSLPIYVSIANPNEVKVPKIKKKKPKNYKVVEGELSTKVDCNVKVKPTGEVVVEKISNKNG